MLKTALAQVPERDPVAVSPRLELVEAKPPRPNSPEYWAQFAENRARKLAKLAETQRKFDEIQITNGKTDRILLDAHQLKGKLVSCELSGSYVVGVCQGDTVIDNGFPRLWNNTVQISSPDHELTALLEPDSVINIRELPITDLPFVWEGDQA